MLEIKNVRVKVEDKEVVKGINLTVNPGEVVALMGPNGSGKSSLAYALSGHPSYSLEGEIFLDGVDITPMTPDQRSLIGLFLAFQYPVGIPGVSLRELLVAMLKARGSKEKVIEIRNRALELAGEIGLKEELLTRDVNDNFSGGEKKKAEILQLLLAAPKYAVMDETDSGLDVDALKLVSLGANKAVKNGTGLLVITHYQRLLSLIKPDRVVIMKDGVVVDEGGADLVLKIEGSGYKDYE